MDHEEERLRRNFNELLQELRVAQTGVQILFAFLLTIAFSPRFTEIDRFERVVYLVALLSAAAAAAMIIAPVAQHRILFRRGRKPEVVGYAHRMARGGLVFMLISMISSVLLITGVVVSRPVSVVLTAVTAAWFLLLWLILPLRSRRGPEGWPAEPPPE